MKISIPKILTPKISILLLGLLALPLLAAPAVKTAADAVTIGDPSHPGALPQALQNAYSSGAKKIVIKPGTYFLPNLGHTAFPLNGWTNVTISAYGVTLILTDLKWTHDAFDFNHCIHVTLAGAVISQNQITSYQGRVTAVGKDDAGKAYCDWKPDAGYPVPPAQAKGFLGGDVNVVDAHTRLLKVGCGDFYGVSYQALPGGTFRAQMGGSFGVGDWLVGRYGDAPFKVYLNDSRDCTIKDVTLVRNGFAPLRDDGGGGNHYTHVVWALGPPPAGGTEKPLVTNSADGMHMIGSYPGPDIENCVFQGIFLDDCIAIHGSFQTINAVSGKVLTLKGGIGALKVGEPVRISDTKGFFGGASVVSLKDNGDKTTTVTLDKDLGVPVGAKLSNPLADGAGYKIIGCHLGNTRSRGILAKGDNGQIENNVIEGCGQAAISLGPEYYWGEADYVQNITVEGNIIRENGKCAYGGGAVLVHGDGAMGNRNITIAHNRFVSNYQGDIDIQWTDGVTLSANTMTGPPMWPPKVAPKPVIALANCRAVTLAGNVVYHSSVYQSPLVAAGDTVTDLHGNNPSGIQAAEGNTK
jgi:hypothetical protein